MLRASQHDDTFTIGRTIPAGLYMPGAMGSSGNGNRVAWEGEGNSIPPIRIGTVPPFLFPSPYASPAPGSLLIHCRPTCEPGRQWMGRGAGVLPWRPASAVRIWRGKP